MANQDVGHTGEDVSIDITLNGDSIEIVDAVTEFSVDPVTTDIIRKHLGNTRRDIDKVYEGWEGSMTITAKSRAVVDMLDALIAARAARVPAEITLTVTSLFRNGEVKTDTYVCVVLELSESARRDEVVEYSCNWMTGEQRISV